MTNALNTRKSHIGGYKGDPRVPYAWKGWNDALFGHPFDYTLLDRAQDSALGGAYETARLRVLALRDAGLPVPFWKSPKSIPRAIDAALSLTSSLNKMARAEQRGFWPIGKSGWLPAETQGEAT